MGTLYVTLKTKIVKFLYSNNHYEEKMFGFAIHIIIKL